MGFMFSLNSLLLIRSTSARYNGLMLTLILFLAFSYLLCHPEDTKICVYAVSPDSKQTERGRHLCASQSAGINNGIALVSCHPWKYVPQAISGGMNLLKQMSSKRRSQKLPSLSLFQTLIIYLSYLSLSFIYLNQICSFELLYKGQLSQ